jgi:hypothetical protein
MFLHYSLKAITGIVLTVLVFWTVSASVLSPSNIRAGRIEQDMNTGWRFERIDSKSNAAIESSAVSTDPPTGGRERFAYDDSHWDAVTLPHTPRIEPARVQFPWQGICWYRRDIQVQPEWKGKKVFLYFEAGMQIADI